MTPATALDAAPGARRRVSVVMIIAIAALLAAELYYGWIAWSQQASHHTFPHDVGLIDYSLHWTLHGRFMYSPLIGRSHFGVHFTPTLLLALPFYALRDGPLTLLLFQSALLAGAAAPLFLLARHATNSRALAALTAGLYLVNYYVGCIHQASHYEALLPFCAFSAMYCALAGHRRAYWIFLVLALGVKTDVALYMVPFGLYLLLAQRDRRLGWGTMGLSLAWFLLAAAVTRAFAPAGATPAYLKFYGVYGDSLPAIALDILAHPGRIPLSLVSRPLLTLLATCGFLFLADWRSALLILPPAAVVLLSPDPDFRMLAYYRSAPIIPFLFFATALGAAQLARGPRPAKGLLIAFMAALLAVNGVIWLTQPTLSNGFPMRPFEVTARERAAADIARRLLPLDGRLAVQWDLYCQVPHRAEIALLDDYADADYLFVDLKGNLGPTPPAVAWHALGAARADMDILADEDGLILARRRPH
ncbi:MAG: DUF2079 domain-containing protein [Candidatus Brocadiia bacterium]